jgi:Divergent InlB B-repeat domain
LNQDYTVYAVNKLLSITINIVGSGNVETDPDKDYYSKGSLITMTATANSGWLFSEWSGELDSSDNPERISINSDMTITAVFLADYDNDGVSNKEENAGPIDGDGNNDGILDSLQSNVSSLAIDNATDYVVLETPPGTSIKNCKAVIEPPDNNYPSGVDFSYGFFSFTVAGIRIGGSTSVTFYFPSEITFNTYSRYGPTPDDPFDHWYEFIFDGQTGAKLNKNNTTLHFVDGKRGDDDLTENGIIVDIGGPGIKANISPEFDSKSDVGGGDSYGCFVGCLLEISAY